MKLLLIEDDAKLAEHLTENLKEQGFLCVPVGSYEDLMHAIQSPLHVELIIMDRLLGSFDTKNVFQNIKSRWPLAPLIVLSAISTPNEKTHLINMGADDYVGKPFATHELVARIRAQLRKTSAPVGNFLKVGNLVIDSLSRIISVGEQAESLPAKEFLVLRTLALDPSKIWSKNELLDYIWGQATSVETNVVESTIANIRRKLGELGADVEIRNMRNAGYWIAQ